MAIRVLRSSDTPIRHLFFEADDETVADAEDTVLVFVADSHGVELAGGPGIVAAEGGYVFTLSAGSHCDDLRKLTLTWTATVGGLVTTDVERIDVVGSRYFRLHTLRAMQGLGNSTQFQNIELSRVRDYVEEFIDDFTENAWTLQYRSEVFTESAAAVRLGRSNVGRIIAARLGGVQVDIGGWSVSADGLVRFGEQLEISDDEPLLVEYEWGEDQVPADLHLASLKLARHLLLSTDSSIPDRAKMLTTSYGSFLMSVASEERPTGLPEIDSVLVRRRYGTPRFIA